MKFIAEAGSEYFYDNSMSDDEMSMPYIDQLRYRIDTVKEADAQFKEYVKEEKQRKRREVKVDSDLSDFLV
jgi:hypothetical protein